MRPPDFRLEVWGFATPPVGPEGACVVVTCSRCKKELSRHGAAEPGKDLAADLRAVLEHYENRHFREVQP